MSKKLHDILRKLQLLIPALIALYGAFDEVFGWGLMETVETLRAAVVTFIGVLAQHSSHKYFETKSIVTKILPDKAQEEIQKEEV